MYSSRFSTYAVTSSGEPSYVMLFETDGGTEVPSQIVRVKDGGRAERPENPLKEGLQFNGWYATESRAGETFHFDADAIHADTTLYAKWGPKLYRVTITIKDKSNAVRSVSLSDSGGETVEDVAYGVYRLTSGAYRLNLNVQGQSNSLSHAFSIPGGEA